MTKSKFNALTASNKKNAENFARLEAKHHKLDSNAQKNIALFVQNLFDEILILGYDFDEFYTQGLKNRLNILCSDYPTHQELLVRQICTEVTSLALLAVRKKRINVEDSETPSLVLQ